MRVWRISNYSDLSGRGGLVSNGRWHRINTPIVYASDHPATAMLETLAHLDIGRVPLTYRLLAIELPDDAPMYRVADSELPADWRTDLDWSQSFGTRIFSNTEHLVVLVPTVLVPHAWNALLNPRHAEMSRCSITEIIEGVFDPRLIR